MIYLCLLLLLTIVLINGQPNYGPCDKDNLINCMDQRIRALEGHFYPIPNAISELEKYFNDNGESILDLDLSIRKLVNGGNGNDASDAINNYLSVEQPKVTRNSYNLLQMDIELYNLQQRAKDLENKEDALEDNDYDKDIFVLIKQAQCELSQLGLPEPANDCRVNACYNNNDLNKMFDDLSPPPDGQCPIGYQERVINNLQSGAHSLNYNNNNKPDINNLNKLFDNKANGNNLDMLQKQIYILYALIALLFTSSITIFCYSFYGSAALPKKQKKMVYEPVQQ